MARHRFLLLALFSMALVVAGCVSSSSSEPSSPNASIGNTSSNASLNASPEVGPRQGQAALCFVASGDNQVELILLDAERYVYELKVDGRTTVEMVYLDEGLYVHYFSPPVPGCEWMFLSREDLGTVKQLGGLRFMSHAELANQLSADRCQVVPLEESVFSRPPSACPLQEVILRAQAG